MVLGKVKLLRCRGGGMYCSNSCSVISHDAARRWADCRSLTGCFTGEDMSPFVTGWVCVNSISTLL